VSGVRPPVPLARALEALLSEVRPVDETESCALADAHGRILAEDQHARLDMPPWDNSAMDGYAVHSSHAGRQVPVAARIAAGDDPVDLVSGTAARIFTGAPLPAGADAVVMQEDVVDDNGSIFLPDTVHAGQHVRQRGQECRSGECLLAAGRRLRPQDIGLLASQGIAQVPVRRRLRVAVVSTGSELVGAASGTLRRGQLYNSNGPMLEAWLQMLGCLVQHVDPVRDSRDETRLSLADAASRADLVLSTGGVSVGDADHVRGAVETLGELSLWRVAVKPGKPFAFGRIREAVFMGLPGNPASAFVTFLLLARPWIDARQGRRERTELRLFARADFERDGSATREEYLRVRLRDGAIGRELDDFTEAEADSAPVSVGARDGGMAPGLPWATPFVNQSSGILRSVSAADALARVPAAQVVRHGDPVTVLPLDRYLW
jgi:molybdopterin molybdotransferase